MKYGWMKTLLFSLTFLHFIFCNAQSNFPEWNARIANPRADFFNIDASLDSAFNVLPTDTSEGSPFYEHYLYNHDEWIEKLENQRK